MADKSSIEWTDATWNIITGCSIVSPGCRRCYAMKLAGSRLRNHPSRVGLTRDTASGQVWTGEVRFNEGWLDQPMRWRRGRMIFVCAHSDLFHPDVPDEWIDKIFAVMALCPQHTFQVLTKRSARMREYCGNAATPYRIARVVLDMMIQRKLASDFKFDDNWPVASEGDDVDMPDDVTLKQYPLPNVWLGTSIERQKEADERLPDLVATLAAVRFISAEPLLEEIEIIQWFGTANIRLPKRAPDIHPPITEGTTLGDAVKALGGSIDTVQHIHMVIVGGESASDAKPMHPKWVQSISYQCQAAHVAFMFKQWGSWVTEDQSPDDIVLPGKSRTPWAQRDKNGDWTLGDQTSVYHVGKKAAGRLLDGREHNDMPPRRSAE